MNISRSAVLGLIAGIGAAAGVALTLTGVAAPASAQDWRGSAPVFQSDIERQQRQAEAQRAERSKAYGTTSYPKFMQGGAKPDIAPEQPPTSSYSTRRASPTPPRTTTPSAPASVSARSTSTVCEPMPKADRC